VQEGMKYKAMERPWRISQDLRTT